jgi:acyl-CoA synthetase (AMP-forming)/AMP-acid ligase II/acyl carrier protein
LAEATLMVTASGIGKGYQTLEVNSQQLEQSKIVIETVISEETKTLVSAGQQILSQQIKIVQPKTQAALNELKVGEIWVSGEHVSKGYWNNPMMSQQKLKAQIQNEADEYLRTGDLGFMYQGELFVTGRIKDLIKVRGRSIYPQDIEFAIEDLQSKWTEIKDGGIGVFSHEENGLERLVAFVEIQPKRNPNHHPQQLTNEIVEIISNQFDIALADVVLIKSGTLPKTTSGKIQRYLCRQYYLSHFEGQRLPLFQMSKQDKSIESKTSTRFNASKIQFKIWLIDWVAQELEISSTEIQGNEALANYGLESLAAVSLADAIEEKLKINVSSTLAYDLKTIDAIVEHLAK